MKPLMVILSLFLLIQFSSAATDNGFLQNEIAVDSTSAGFTSTIPADNSVPSGSSALTLPSDQQDEPVLGKENAPIKIEEYSDFQCPFCGMFFSDTFPYIKTKYIDAGIANFSYRDFPLSFHPDAEPAAIAAQCALEQGQFWKMHDLIFQNQNNLSTDLYKQFASELGLDTIKFNSCIESKKYLPEVLDDYFKGASNGVSGTPTFFINGEKLVGAQPFANFEQKIDEILKKDYCGNNYCDFFETLQSCPIDCTFTVPTCNGCFSNGLCIDRGTRALSENGSPLFCGLDNSMQKQASDSAVCQNNFECLSNNCSYGKCFNPTAKFDENKRLLQQIITLIKQLIRAR